MIFSGTSKTTIWWRRRELDLDSNLLINIGLMGLKIRFCYILCYFTLAAWIKFIFCCLSLIVLTDVPGIPYNLRTIHDENLLV